MGGGATNLIKIIGIENKTNIMLISNVRSYKVDRNRCDLYHLYPYLEKSDTLKVLVGDCVAFSKQFDCLSFPNYKTVLGETNDTALTNTEIVNNPFLNLVLIDCFYKVDYHVVRYDISFLLKKSKIKLPKRIGEYRLVIKRRKQLYESNLIPIDEPKYRLHISFEKDYKVLNTTVYENKLPKEHLDIINLMQSGDKLVFDNIIIRKNDGADVNIGPLTITIK